MRTLNVPGPKARSLIERDRDLILGLVAGPLDGASLLPLFEGRPVQRTTPLWLVSVDETEQGIWDLAVDLRQDGNLFKLQGSSTPPSGETDRAELSARVPLPFAQAFPETTLTMGIRSMVSAIDFTDLPPISAVSPGRPHRSTTT